MKPKLDILKSKYYSEYPSDEYARIVLDVSNIKDTNNELTLQNKLLNKLTNNNISLQLELVELSANLQNEIHLLQDNSKELKRNLNDLHV